jgi:hypothetical protein
MYPTNKRNPQNIPKLPQNASKGNFSKSLLFYFLSKKSVLKNIQCVLYQYVFFAFEIVMNFIALQVLQAFEIFFEFNGNFLRKL